MAHSIQGNADLIKTVRGLDQTGVGENGENLELLWRSLTASTDGCFHAAEQSSLRWLLKSMNGSSQAAETLRRSPLAWNILAFVFRRIPLFSLAKSLADRRFIAVIQQALKEVSVPDSAAPRRASTKRKLSPSTSYNLDGFKSTEGCIVTGHAIFGALGTLLHRLEDSEASTHDRIGAEHLRSLFSLSATEASSIVSPALITCAFSIEDSSFGDDEGKETWISVVSNLWALHLQNSDDITEFAAHLFGPAAAILNNLQNLPDHQDGGDSDRLSKQWREDLQQFVLRNFILPVRSTYLSRQDSEPIDLALKATSQNLDVSAPILFFFSCTAVEQLAEQGVRKGNAEWMQKLFQICDAFVRERSDGSEIMLKILQQARERSMPLKVGDLRSACRRYALKDGLTDWAMVAHVAQCDPDVFQVGEDGQTLLEDVCQRSLDDNISDANLATVSEVVDAIVRGFRTARAFNAFLKLWFQQLSKLEDRKSEEYSPWYAIGREGSLMAFDFSSIEGTMSPQQLLEVIEWVEKEGIHPKALSVWLSVVSQGVVSENFQDIVGERLLTLSISIKKTSSDKTALKWRVVSRVMGWVAATQRSEAWAEIQKDLKKILKKSPIESAETFEAFKCCCRLWVAMSPDDPQADEVAELVEAFTSRLATEITSYVGRGKQESVEVWGTETEAELRSDTAIQQYLNWYLRGSSRLNHLYFKKHGSLLPTLQHLITASTSNASSYEYAWRSLLENEHNANHVQLASNLIDQAIAGLRESKQEKAWPGESGNTWLRLISSFPLDVMSRPQREAVVAALMDGTKGRIGFCNASPESLKVIFSLVTKLMTRSTFYKDMAFQHLVDAADSASSIFAAADLSTEALLEIVDRYSDFAFHTLKQMADDPERSTTYFAEASSFVTQTEEAIKSQNGAVFSAPLRLTLLKTMIRALSGSLNSSKNPSVVSLSEQCRASLGQCVTSIIESWAGDKKLLIKSDSEADLRLFAALDGAAAVDHIPVNDGSKSSSFQKLAARSQEAMESGNLRGWKLQIFLRRHQSIESQGVAPTSFPSLESLPPKIRESLLSDYVGSIVDGMDSDDKMRYLQALIARYVDGCDTDGQLVAIYCLTNQLIGKLHSSLLSLNVERRWTNSIPQTLRIFDLIKAHMTCRRPMLSSRVTSVLQRRPLMLPTSAASS